MAEGERHEARNVRELKQFVDKLPGMQAAKASLATHTTVAELVKAKIDCEEFRPSLELEQFILEGGATDYLEQVEDLAIGSETPLLRMLRLICLQSVVSSGLKPRLFDQYRRLILQVSNSFKMSKKSPHIFSSHRATVTITSSHSTGLTRQACSLRYWKR